MTIDTEIRHATKAGANLFLELGFSAAEAMKLHAASRTAWLWAAWPGSKTRRKMSILASDDHPVGRSG